jgi:hypothetical protein
MRKGANANAPGRRTSFKVKKLFCNDEMNSILSPVAGTGFCQFPFKVGSKCFGREFSAILVTIRALHLR